MQMSPAVSAPSPPVGKRPQLIGGDDSNGHSAVPTKKHKAGDGSGPPPPARRWRVVKKANLKRSVELDSGECYPPHARPHTHTPATFPPGGWGGAARAQPRAVGSSCILPKALLFPLSATRHSAS